MTQDFKPIPGSAIFNALKDQKCIVMACNVRMVPGVMRGLFRAAKDSDSALMVEMARSECNLQKGYTGMTPEDYARASMEVAEEVGFDMWALHADHIGIKKGTPEDIEATKELVGNQIENGFTSFAIDASHLFDFKGRDLKEELRLNIDATTRIGLFIKEKMAGKPFGLEVEVGEIGKEDEHGRVLTKAEEAVTFISELNKNGVFPHVIAIANGTAHGNVYDANGTLIEDISIDIPQTQAVAKALKDMGSGVRIAQHGITGTPLPLINSDFPKGHILKGNVGTFWMNIVWETLEVFEPELYQKIWSWTLDTYSEEAAKKGMTRDIEVFGKYSKFAIKQFFDELHALNPDTLKALEARAYFGAAMFMKAFGSVGMTDRIKI